jgi:UDP-N-acetylmuramyl pentapeptide phosphotransferase/UDP-N-acetylglucosamine-1-phosphate transferase
MSETILSTQHVTIFWVSLIGCVFLFLTQRWHGRFTFDHVLGVQKSHTRATPRIGGLAIFIALAYATQNAPPSTKEILYPALTAGAVAFLIGLIEDLTNRVSALTRLIATMASPVLAWLMTGVSVTHLSVPGLDALLGITLFSVLFTAFAVGGIANAVNLIDGYNGMASGFVVLAMLAVASASGAVGDEALRQASFLIAAAYLGFFVVNWPLGRIFLGDSGAYLGGFLVGWLCVLLVQRNDSVSPFAALLICIHPVTETLYSILRRISINFSITKPDRLHLHNLLCEQFLLLTDSRTNIANPLSGISITALSAPSLLLISYTYSSNNLCLTFSFLFILFYLWLYHKLKMKILIKNFTAN